MLSGSCRTSGSAWHSCGGCSGSCGGRRRQGHAMKQNIKRINHVAIFVNPENFDKTVDSLEKILEIKFEQATRHDYKVRIAVDHHNSGLEVLAPTTADSEVANIIRQRGEGYTCIVMGVKDCDAAAARAVKLGYDLIPEVGLDGTEP